MDPAVRHFSNHNRQMPGETFPMHSSFSGRGEVKRTTPVWNPLVTSPSCAAGEVTYAATGSGVSLHLYFPTNYNHPYHPLGIHLTHPSRRSRHKLDFCRSDRRPRTSSPEVAHNRVCNTWPFCATFRRGREPERRSLLSGSLLLNIAPHRENLPTPGCAISGEGSPLMWRGMRYSANGGMRRAKIKKQYLHTIAPSFHP
jgi:hypothetical protein